jgi:hypothetical protein
MFWATMQGLALDWFLDYLTMTFEMCCRMLGLFKNGQFYTRKEAVKTYFKALSGISLEGLSMSQKILTPDKRLSAREAGTYKTLSRTQMRSVCNSL